MLCGGHELLPSHLERSGNETKRSIEREGEQSYLCGESEILNWRR